ncbi:hypothetical protein [Deinococcus sp. RL]|uniref:hypothetical protein n=1 Tax=Deinococcus sp. RL TaxID=1489678 RepID=UPI0009DEF3B6|nr:hypothetical protein [Deinococcus sp. RL]
MTNGDPTHQPALPDDAGNGMSDRSGSYDESESGMTNTPTFPANPAAPADAPASGTMTNTGTTFGPDGDDEGR